MLPCFLLLFATFCYGILGNSVNPKTWWAKPVTPDVFTAGRLSLDQYKYATEIGFRSIISLITFTTQGNFGDETLPTTDEANRTVTELTNAKFYILLEPGEDWDQRETVLRLRAALDEAPRPVLFHCASAYRASFIYLLHLANVTRYNSSAEPWVDIHEIFRRGALLGYDYVWPNLLGLASEITGQPIPNNPAQPDVSLPSWLTFWHVKPVLFNWYSAGQIQDNHVESVDLAGWSSLINIRKGSTTPPNNDPSQEEVPLLNIHDNTGTYTDGGRQSTARLLATRIDPNKPNRYISNSSGVNYASRNYRCFGDDIGYSEEQERESVDFTDVLYLHLPIGGQYGWNLEMWNAYRDTLMAASAMGSVLIHCGTIFRAVVLTVLAAGYEYGLNSTWAISRAAELGVSITEEQHPDIVQLFRNVLDFE